MQYTAVASTKCRTKGDVYYILGCVSFLLHVTCQCCSNFTSFVKHILRFNSICGLYLMVFNSFFPRLIRALAHDSSCWNKYHSNDVWTMNNEHWMVKSLKICLAELFSFYHWFVPLFMWISIKPMVLMDSWHTWEWSTDFLAETFLIWMHTNI